MGRYLRASLEAAKRGGYVRSPPSARSAHEFSYTRLTGGPLPLAQFQGRVLLVVNTACRCGFTPQLAGLQALWQALEPHGLTVLGVPSNDFGGSEPGAEAEIARYLAQSFGISFPMAGKTAVTGPDAHPFYAWAAARLGPASKPRWNFHKYLVAPDGRMAGWFPTATPPTAAPVIEAVQGLLSRAG